MSNYEQPSNGNGNGGCLFILVIIGVICAIGEWLYENVDMNVMAICITLIIFALILKSSKK